MVTRDCLMPSQEVKQSSILRDCSEADGRSHVKCSFKYPASIQSYPPTISRADTRVKSLIRLRGHLIQRRKSISEHHGYINEVQTLTLELPPI